MVLPITFYLPYWLVFFLIPVRLITQEGYKSKYQSIIASEYWPAVVFAASIGICCFLGGYSLIARKKKQEKNAFRKSPSSREVMVIKVSAWILLFIAVAAFGVFMISGGTDLYKGGYVHVRNLDWTANVAYIAFENGFRGATGLWAIYLLLCYKLRWHHLIPISCLGIMLLAMVLSGDRGLLAWFGICVLVIYSQRRPIKLWHMLFFVLLGSLTFSVIQKVRPTGERTVTAYTSAIKEVDLFEGLTQYAESTASTITNAFDAVEKNGYFHGTFFGQGLLSIVPFYGKLFPWLPAVKDSQMDGTGAYMTNYVFGYHKYGLATTVVTDIYLDFGLIGVSVIMFFYGCFGGYLYNCRDRGKYHFGLLCYAFFVPAFMYSTRASVTSSFRLLWTILLCYVILIAVDNLMIRRRRIKIQDEN
jgi:oligosaccharide repeat unit polymerase